MSKPTFYATWQLHRPGETCEILRERGYWAEVYSGNRYGDQPKPWPPGRRNFATESGRPADPGMIYPYVLTTSPPEELAAVRDEVMARFPRPEGCSRVVETLPPVKRSLAATDYAYLRYLAWRESTR
jgi:hypothetical protein